MRCIEELLHTYSQHSHGDILAFHYSSPPEWACVWNLRLLDELRASRFRELRGEYSCASGCQIISCSASSLVPNRNVRNL